ncbi:hypothetical protein LINPERHAP1_LOCUS3347 [Linum perenne]
MCVRGSSSKLWGCLYNSRGLMSAQMLTRLLQLYQLAGS